MKLNAHPMVVAVALGLLGPGALVEEEEEATCASSSCPPARSEASTELDGWQPGAPPDPEEFHRVAVEWETYCGSPGAADGDLSSPSVSLKV